jgi:hypothetical protein
MADTSPYKFIITDPCYIMDKGQYHAICDRRIDEPDFEQQSFPLASKDKDTGRPIVFWTIIGTGGDGSFRRSVRAKDGTVRKEEVFVDSGMLCVAEDPDGWDKSVGATYRTLRAALTALPRIARKL